MEEKIEQNNIEVKKEERKEEPVEKGEALTKVLGEYLKPSVVEPKTHEEDLKRVLSQYPDTVISAEGKEELKRTAKEVEEFMEKLTVTKAPVIKSAKMNKKGKMKKELQSTINLDTVDKSKKTRENSSDNKEVNRDKIQEI